MIREATKQDIDALLSIYNQAVLHTTATYDIKPKTKQEMEEVFFSHIGKYIFLVEEEEERILGYASLSRYREREAFKNTVEDSVYVDEACRNKGVGKRLMKAILDFAQKRDDIHTIVALITAENEASIHLQEKYGFSLCGKIKDAGEKFGGYRDLSIYQILL